MKPVYKIRSQTGQYYLNNKGYHSFNNGNGTSYVNRKHAMNRLNEFNASSRRIHLSNGPFELVEFELVERSVTP